MVSFDTTLQLLVIPVMCLTGLAAIQVVCSKFDTNDFQTNRTQFTVQLKSKLQQRCAMFHCDINDVQVNDIRRPTSYESAIRDKQAAVENVQVLCLLRPQSLTLLLKERVTTTAYLVLLRNLGYIYN